MGELVLVRHGQARFAPEGYLGLTDLGRRQAEALGRHLALDPAAVDRVRVGPRARHRETEAAVAAAFHDVGRPWPEAELDAAFDEYDAEVLIARGVPWALARDPSLQQAVSAMGTGSLEARRAFGRVFRVITDAWVEGRLEAEGLEPFAAFRARVAAGVHTVCEAATPGQRILAFTSGGAIGAAVGEAVGATDPHKVFGLSWVHVNAAFTELRFTTGRLSLARFNAVPHLTAELLTGR